MLTHIEEHNEEEGFCNSCEGECVFKNSQVFEGGSEYLGMDEYLL